MRKSYRARGTSDRAREYSKGRLDAKSLSFYDKQTTEYKKKIKALETRRKSLKLKINKVWEQYNNLLSETGNIDDAISKLNAKIKRNTNRKDEREFSHGNKFFQRGYKTLINNERDEFNDFDTNYMSPYARGHTAKIRRNE